MNRLFFMIMLNVAKNPYVAWIFPQWIARYSPLLSPRQDFLSDFLRHTDWVEEKLIIMALGKPEQCFMAS